MKYLREIGNSKNGDSIKIENMNLEKFTIEETENNEVSLGLPLHKSHVTIPVQDEQEALAQLTWKRVTKGDLEALGELYDLYVDELFSYGMGKVQNKTRVMDGIHDLFVDLYKYRFNLSTPTNIKFYLLKSLSRKIFRKQSSAQHISIEDSMETRKLTSSESYEEELIEVEYSNERAKRMRLALSFLTYRQKKALDLKFTQNLPYTEIATAMDISIATSRTLVYRALSVLRKHLGPLALLALDISF